MECLVVINRNTRSPSPGARTNVGYFLDTSGYNVRWNEFTGEAELDGETLGDHRLNDLWSNARAVGMTDGKETFASLLIAETRKDKYHPVREYLKGLTWDGVPRLSRWLSKYLGAEDTALNRCFGSSVLLGAVHRAINPGYKFDLMLVLEGPQGRGKSSALAILGGSWFTDGVRLGDDAKLMIEQTRGKWIIEVPELSGMPNREIEHIKSQISRTEDRARLAYGRMAETVPRQFILIGTTNDDKYLKDRTGNRRFMPVKIGKIDLDALRSNRDQLWAEAHHKVATRGLPANCIPSKLWGEAAEVQKSRMLEDPIEDYLTQWFQEQKGVVEKDGIRMALGEKGFKPSQSLDNSITRIMRGLGWEDTQRRRNGQKPRAYTNVGRGEGDWLEWDSGAFSPEGKVKLNPYALKAAIDP